MKRTEVCKTDVTPFELKLPSEFEVEAKHTVDLPSKYKALVFNEVITKTGYDDNDKVVKTKVDG